VKASAKTRTTAADWIAWEGGSYLMGPLELAREIFRRAEQRVLLTERAMPLMCA
jgi:hypothetical protein